ncbi:MAG TPA: hypothetical protein VNZ50_18145 [Hyphomicrobiaceae bacterium]|jgi:hypothetical protein|nr:hypothetical protein [Hyphomicrobiaceae bacterium]
MTVRLLEQSNRLIDENRRRIERFRAELAAEPAIDPSLRMRVLQQMELSLKCLERHRDQLALRASGGGLDEQRA